MDIQELLPKILLNAILQELHIEAKLEKADITLIADHFLSEQLAQIDKLPEGVALDFGHLENIDFEGQVITTSSTLAVLADKALLPKRTDILAQVVIHFILEKHRLQLGDPVLNIDMIEENWKNKVLNVIVDKVISLKKKQISQIIDSQVNTLLASPPPFHGLKVDYAIYDFIGKSTDEHVAFNLEASGFVNTERDLDRNSKGLSVMLDSSMLFPILLEKINKDIAEKVEQEVEILDLEVIELNKIRARGSAGVMGIKKEFDVFATIVFNKEEQKISLKVDDIKIDGGFLVRKGFEMVEPKVRTMIESAVQIPIKKLLTEKPIPLKLPIIEDKYIADASGLTIADLSISSAGEHLILILEMESFDVKVTVKQQAIQAV